MTGVEILATQEVVVSSTFNWTAFFVAFCATIFIMFLIGVVMSVTSGNWADIIMTIVLGIVAGSLFGGLCGSEIAKPTEYETQYKVTISDEVPMNDFLERYEIIDQEGKIYTVREING